MASLLNQPRARIIVLVNAMAEAHQHGVIFPDLHTLQELRNVLHVTDMIQHLQHGLVGAAVCRAPQRGDAGRDTGKRVGPGRACQAHRGGGGVLLVVGMQDQNVLHGLGQHRVWLPFLARRAEHHIEEVIDIRKIVTRVHKRLTGGVLVGHGRDRRQLGDQPEGGNLAAARIVDIDGVVIKRRQRADHAAHDRHWVRVTAKAVVKARELFMHHGVVRDGVDEFRQLRRIRQLAVHNQVGHFEEAAIRGQILDRITAILQYADVTINVRDAGAAACRGHEAGVVGKQARFAIEGAHIDHIRPFIAAINREIHGRFTVVEGKGRQFLAHAVLQNSPLAGQLSQVFDSYE